MMKKNKIRFEKGRCIYATYYNVSCDSGSIKLWIEDKNPRELFLSNLLVQQAERRKGIGQSLLDYSEKAAHKLGLRKITLTVLRGSWMEAW